MEERVQKIIDEHTQEDRKAFARIDELLILNGDHMSNFRKDILETKKEISEIKDMLIKQNEDYKLHNAEIKAHMKRVEPMLTSYEENATASKVAMRWGKKATVIAGVIGALYIIKEFIVTILIKR